MCVWLWEGTKGLRSAKMWDHTDKKAAYSWASHGSCSGVEGALFLEASTEFLLSFGLVLLFCFLSPSLPFSSFLSLLFSSLPFPPLPSPPLSFLSLPSPLTPEAAYWFPYTDCPTVVLITQCLWDTAYFWAPPFPIIICANSLPMNSFLIKLQGSQLELLSIIWNQEFWMIHSHFLKCLSLDLIRWFSWLDYCLEHQKVMGLIPSQGKYLGCWSDP